MSGAGAILQAHPGLIEQFVSTLFRYADEDTFISLRAFDQHDRGQPPVYIDGVPVGADLAGVVQGAVRVAQIAANSPRPSVFAPPVATFTNAKRARTQDVANGVAISVELDGGDTKAARTRLEYLLGPATLVVASGGEWTDPNTGELHPKLHLHWRLSEPTRTLEEHEDLHQARWFAAVLVGGDRTAPPLAHPLRWPGSWNRKASPKLATTQSANPDAEVNLGEALAALQEAVEAAGLERGSRDSLKASGPPQAPVEHVASALAHLPNLDVPWDEWTRIGMAAYAATGGSPEGLEAWEAWSARSGKDVVGACEERWKHYATSPPSRVGAGTIFFLARAAGWNRAKLFPRDGAAREDDPRPEPPPHSGDGQPNGPRANGQRDPAEPEWGEPISFFADEGAVPQLRPEHVPEALFPFVSDTASRMGVDPVGVAVSALVACASVITDDWRVQPKRLDYTWTEQPRIWGAIVGDPSVLKSPVITACTRPIEKLDAEARARHADEMRAYRKAHKAWKADKSGELDEPRQPRLDRYMVEASTVEALSEVLRDDDEAKQRAPARKVLSRHDEMSEFFGGLDRYRSGGKGGGDRGAYLRLYNGGRHSIDRIGRGSFAVSNWSACFLGGIQPGPIQQIAQEAADDGLLQRFIYCVPGGQGEGRDDAPDRSALDRYAALIRALVAMTPAGGPEGAGSKAVVFHEAAHRHREAIDQHARALSMLPDTSARLKAAFGKWPGLFARLALLFHLIEVGDARARGVRAPVTQVISEGTAARVSSFMLDIVLPHLLRAEAVMFSTARTQHARWIAGWILAHGLESVTTREITRAYGALRAPDAERELRSVMDSLVTVGWLDPVAPANPLRAVHAWKVNPRVHIVFADVAEQERGDRLERRQKIADTVAARRASRDADGGETPE